MQMEKRAPLLNTVFLSVLTTLIASTIIILNSCSSQNEPDLTERRQSFDEGWRFLKDSLPGPENPYFNDSNWRILDIPHDWSIEDLPGQNDEDIIGPFDKSSIDKMSSGYLVGGIGWYRKSFTINEEDKDKVVYLQFDGVYMNSDVWLNGKHLGFHPYGYTPFYYDITSSLKPAGQANVVSVRVKNEGLNSRWYSGSGINRHVWLTVVNPVHIVVPGGLYITTPAVSENSSEVKIVTTLVNKGSNDKNIVLQTQLYDPSGKLAGSANSNSAMAPGQSVELIQNVPVLEPALWSIDEPNLYQATSICTN